MAAAVTLKKPETLPLAVTTVIVPIPVVAVAAMLTHRVSEVAVTEAIPAVTPLLLKKTVAPARLLPVMVRV